jgi:hypothetical protein
MNPIVLRGLILATEVLVFLLVTVVGASFVAHALAQRFAESEPPPAEFPVVVFEGDRARPEPQHYRVVRWSEWPRLAEERPQASLLLPETRRSLQLADGGRAAFTASEAGESGQTVELDYAAGERALVAVYSARAREISPRYLRTSSTNTFLMGALLGFFVGVMVGKALRRTVLPRFELPRAPHG